MSDTTTIGLLVGVLVVLATRAIDWWFPKGWHFKGIRRYGEPDGEDDAKNTKENSND